ncbi:hypothetical protein F4775DRAFT_537635 [Biscogniauxia sp. FL1348]|nr:hypothetical protein F4775DRAFT_537635 [Biscogniauxia sp. FL1348]
MPQQCWLFALPSVQSLLTSTAARLTEFELEGWNCPPGRGRGSFTQCSNLRSFPPGTTTKPSCVYFPITTTTLTSR